MDSQIRSHPSDPGNRIAWTPSQLNLITQFVAKLPFSFVSTPSTASICTSSMLDLHSVLYDYHTGVDLFISSGIRNPPEHGVE